jgi:hypothetical protein
MVPFQALPRVPPARRVERGRAGARLMRAVEQVHGDQAGCTGEAGSAADARTAGVQRAACPRPPRPRHLPLQPLPPHCECRLLVGVQLAPFPATRRGRGGRCAMRGLWDAPLAQGESSTRGHSAAKTALAPCPEAPTPRSPPAALPRLAPGASHRRLQPTAPVNGGRSPAVVIRKEAEPAHVVLL